MNQKGFLSIALIIIVIAFIGAGAYFVSTKQITLPTLTPVSAPHGEKIMRKVGDKEGSFLIQKINPNSVDGLWYEAVPVVRSNDPGLPKTLHVGDDIGYACEGVSDILTSIDFSGQGVTFTKIIG